MRSKVLSFAWATFLFLVGGVTLTWGAPIVVFENPEQFDTGFGFPPGTPDLWRAYDVYNNSNVEGPAVQVVAVVVTNPEPLTEWIRHDWMAADIATEQIWNQPMRGEFGEAGGDLTWSDFFGGVPFPGPANGYYLDYVREEATLAFADHPIAPGEASVRELWFAGPIASEFLVAAVPAEAGLSNVSPTALTVFSGVATVPEPGACGLALAAIWAAGRLRCRRP